MKQNLGCALPFLLAILLATLFLFNACSSAKTGSDYQNNMSGAPSVKEEGFEHVEQPDSGDFEQKRVLKGHITAESTDFNAALDTLEQKIAALGGYIGSSEINGNSLGSSGRRRASLTVRIPAASFHDFIGGLSEFLNVTSESTTSEDITQSYYDTESKLNSLKIQEERLLAMLEKTEDLHTLLQLEERLAEIRQQIAYYDSLLRAYNSQVDYATVTVTLYEVLTLTEPEETETTFGQEIASAFKESWSIFVEVLKVILLILIYLLPLLLVATVIILVIRMILKKTAAKRHARAMAEMQRYEAMRAAHRAAEQHSDPQP